MSSNGKAAFGGTIGKTIASSKPWWPQAPKAPDGAAVRTPRQRLGVARGKQSPF